VDIFHPYNMENLEEIIDKVNRVRGTLHLKDRYLTSIDESWVYKCPYCEKNTVLSCNKQGRDKYCSQCGTKLYWDEVDKKDCIGGLT